MKKVFYDIADIKEKYIAHIDWIDKNDSAKGFVIQTVEEHLNGVANFAESTCSGINIGNTGKLLGLLHDMGKYSNKFQDRIRNSFLGKDAEKVDHSAAGALWLYNNAGILYQYTSTIYH
jgi:CRISPR-associated endonuclease/helicase Cas3